MILGTHVLIPYICDSEDNRGDPRPLQRDENGDIVATKRIAFGYLQDVFKSS